MRLGSVAPHLTCPVDGAPVHEVIEGGLLCCNGHHYPVVEGVPVLLRDDVSQTMGLAAASIARARYGLEAADTRNPALYLESLGISEAEKTLCVRLAERQAGRVDPVVQVIVGATSGYGYKHLIGELDDYPIPNLRLPQGEGKALLDVGCNWGRWSLAGVRKGYTVTGLDPSLGAIMAARRVATQLGECPSFLVGDARYLPFEGSSFDVVFSYSVLQHFSRSDVALAVAEIGRVLRPGGVCLVQMAHRTGVRNLQVQARRSFREGRDFEVRYWSIADLRALFSDRVGETSVQVDCFFGLGLQPADRLLMPSGLRAVVSLSELLRRMSLRVAFLTHLADSIFIGATKAG